MCLCQISERDLNEFDEVIMSSSLFAKTPFYHLFTLRYSQQKRV